MVHLEPEKMISHWWSKTLPLPTECEEWIEKSYSDPGAFWNSLFTLHQKNRHSPTQSSLGKNYDFYHDCILRHLHTNDIAYTVIRKNQADHWTYIQIHHCVNYHVRKWSQHPLRPGDLAAIVVSPGIEFVIGLMTALRLGLSICFLPLHTNLLGYKHIEQILSELSPQWIITDQQEKTFNESIPHLPIDIKGQDDQNQEPISFPYKAARVLQTALAFYRQEPFAYVPLDAHTMYLQAMRDYQFSLNLNEHSSWAIPLACPVRTEPCSTLTTLLAGARMVYVPDALLRDDPSLLKNEKISLIGISPPLQQLWNQLPGAPKSLDACFKMPYDINVLGWKAFLHANKLEKVAAFQLLMDNSMGGTLWLSRPQADPWNIYLKISPGISWSLNDIEGYEVNSTPGYGLFTAHLSAAENVSKTTNLTLSQMEKNFMFTGFLQPCRDGFTFPVHELEESVNALAFVEGCSLLPMPKAGQQFNSHMLLLVFIDPALKENIEKNKDEWSQEIHQRIRDHLGGAFLPDQIEYFPLIPKRYAWGVDRDWCASQYRTGWLKQKAEQSVYQILHLLKKLAAGSKKVG